MLPLLDAFFKPAPDGGQRLFLHHTPPDGQPIRGAVVYIHPWAEEMNKSRRMAALVSRALAANGWAVLQVDLLGCGDSSGDFRDATWAAWVDDITCAAQWLLSRHPGVPLWLWGLRAGALLACAAAPRIDRPLNLMFWQPALQGRGLLQQFLRLKAAAQLMDGSAKTILDTARSDLSAGRSVEVAGYLLTSALALGLEAAALTPPPAVRPGHVVWLEMSSLIGSTLSTNTSAEITRWQRVGWQVDAHSVPGPPFWRTTEIEDAPALLTATLAALGAALSSRAPILQGVPVQTEA